MILFAIIIAAVIGLLLYFFVFAGKKKAEGKSISQELGEHP